MDFGAGVLPVSSGQSCLTQCRRFHRRSRCRHAFRHAQCKPRAPRPRHRQRSAARARAPRAGSDARTGWPWARNARRASALLAFFDSEMRLLRVATGPAFLGRRVSGIKYIGTKGALEGKASARGRHWTLDPALGFDFPSKMRSTTLARAGTARSSP